MNLDNIDFSKFECLKGLSLDNTVAMLWEKLSVDGFINMDKTRQVYNVVKDLYELGHDFVTITWRFEYSSRYRIK